MLENLFAGLRGAFPEVEYQLDSGSKSVNAQAFVIGQALIVRLYGGLAFHPRIARDAMCFALLHETGHHLAPGPRLPWDRRLACECAADRWALNEGASALRRNIRRFDAPNAVRQLDRLASSSGATPAPIRRKPKNRACWATNWRRRMNAVSVLGPVHAVGECPLADALLAQEFADVTNIGGYHGASV
ncbi:MAG TPA: hypothetical protein VEU47_10205 [Candidatus Cybelea sp.]|nr:hypothetical protein [Candidatus Cybelea sp.]